MQGQSGLDVLTRGAVLVDERCWKYVVVFLLLLVRSIVVLARALYC